MKKIIFLLGCVFVVVLIYHIKHSDKVIYFEISDKSAVGNKVVNYLSTENMLEDNIYYQNDNNRLVDLLNDIKNNKEINYNNKKYSINNLFIKSKYIVLNIGHNDYKTNSMVERIDYLDKFVLEYEEVLKSIRNISKENIIIIFDYEMNNKYMDYLYNKMSILSRKYDSILLYKDDLMNYIKDFTKNKK